MKTLTKYSIATFILAATTLAQVNAGTIQTSKGDRLTVNGGPSSQASQDYHPQSCPMMQTTAQTTTRDIDSKGHTRFTTPVQVFAGRGCETKSVKQAGDKTVKSEMSCQLAKSDATVSCASMQ